MNNIVGDRQQERALREFKQIMHDLVHLMRRATGLDTVYLYWVNRARRQFVLESHATRYSNTMFKDRVAFEEHYLDEYKDLEEPLTLTIGEDIEAKALTHYYDDNVPARLVTLLPLINNNQTIALTVLESDGAGLDDEVNELLQSYQQALANVLNTYLEISDLADEEKGWQEYEDLLQQFTTEYDAVPMLQKLLDTMQGFISQGGVVLAARGMGSWNVVLESSDSKAPVKLGQWIEKGSLAYKALQEGDPQFAVHFNGAPRRCSDREPEANGATLALPLKINDRRQAVVMAVDDNPLVFRESTKHKLTNLVRIAALQLAASGIGMDVSSNLLTNKYDAFKSEVWEQILLNESNREEDPNPLWLGLVTLNDLSSLRTRLRLDELDQLQRKVVELLNPSKFEICGLVGYHSDYVYALLLKGEESEVEHYVQALKQRYKKAVELDNGKALHLDLKVGLKRFKPPFERAAIVMQQVKSVLSQAVNQPESYSTILDKEQ